MRQSKLANSAVGRDGLEVYDGGWIRILNGGLEVIGSAIVSGVLNVTGTTNLSGENNLSGTNHLTGPTDVAGDFEIIAGGQFKAGESVILPDGSADFGEFHIAPDGTLTAGQFELRPDGSADFADLKIDATGKMTSGRFELNPDGSAKFGDMTVDKDGLITTGETKIDTTGKAEFGDFIIDPASNFPIQAPGGRMFSSGVNQIGLTSDVGAVDLSPTTSRLNFGPSAIELSATGAQIMGQLNLMNVPSAPASDLVPLGIDSNGNVRRIA